VIRHLKKSADTDEEEIPQNVAWVKTTTVTPSFYDYNIILVTKLS